MANRYTQLTASEYKPLSFQELAVAPGMLRQQHDQAIAQQEALRTELNAYSNPLAQHREEAMGLQQTMNSIIDKQAEELATNGYNKNSGVALSRLNREFRNLTSPTGRLGQINAARDAYIKNREEFMKSADAMKWGRSVAERAWNQHASQYGGYDENGDISQIGTLGAPEQYRIMDFAQDAKKIVGNIKRRLDSVVGGRIMERPDGNGWQIVNSSGQVIQDTNVQQLNDLIMAGNVEFFTPGMRGYESAKFEGISPQQLRAQFNSTMASMLVDEVNDTRNQNVSLHGAKNQSDFKDDQGMFVTEYAGINTPLSNKFDSPRKLDNYLHGIKDINNLTPEEYREYQEAIAIKQSLDNTLSRDENYQMLDKRRKELNKKADLPENFSLGDLGSSSQTFNNIGIYSPSAYKSGNYGVDYFYKGEKVSKDKYNELYNKYQGIEKEASSLSKEMNKIQENYLLKTSTTNLQKLNPTTEKQNKQLKLMNENVFNHFKQPNFLNDKNVKVEAIRSSGDSDIMYVKDKDKVSIAKDAYELFGQLDAKDFKVNGFTYDENGKGIIVEVSAKLGDKAKGVRFGSIFGNNTKVNGGESVDLQLRVDGVLGQNIANGFANISNQYNAPGNETLAKTGYGTSGQYGMGYENRIMGIENMNANYGWNEISPQQALQNPDLNSKLRTLYREVNGKNTNDVMELINFHKQLSDKGFKVGAFK